jgi:hypothetical protein
MEVMRNAYKILVEKPEGKRPFRRPSRWEYTGNSVGGFGLDLSGLGYEPVAACCEHTIETWGFIKEEEKNFLNQMSVL